MTYVDLVLIFLAASAVPLGAAVLLHRPGRRWWAAQGLTLLALSVLTAVFDSLMIAADLFRYEESNLSGIHVWLAPIEDFAWPLAAVMVVPSLMLLLEGRSRGRRGPAAANPQEDA